MPELPNAEVAIGISEDDRVSFPRDTCDVSHAALRILKGEKNLGTKQKHCVLCIYMTSF